jgi:hypothetical protein
MANPIPASVYQPNAALDSNPYYMTLRLAPYSRPSPFYKTEFKTEKIIMLPLPSEIRDDTNIGYSTSDLQLVGDVINGGAGAAESFALRMSGTAVGAGTTALGAGVGGGLGAGIAKLFKKSNEDIAVMAQRGANIGGGLINSAIPPEQITAAVQQITGLAPNPNPSQMFTGMELRQFNMSWVFMPRNKTESSNVTKIIKTLKQLSLPSTQTQNVAAILKYPYMCQVNFYPWDNPYGSNEWGWGPESIIRMKRCFISSVNVNYAPSNVPAFFEGTHQPTTIMVSVALREMEYFLSDDWSDGGSKFRTEASPYSNITDVPNLAQRLASDAAKAASDTLNPFTSKESETQAALKGGG